MEKCKVVSIQMTRKRIGEFSGENNHKSACMPHKVSISFGAEWLAQHHEPRNDLLLAWSSDGLESLSPSLDSDLTLCSAKLMKISKRSELSWRNKELKPCRNKWIKRDRFSSCAKRIHLEIAHCFGWNFFSENSIKWKINQHFIAAFRSLRDPGIQI